MIRARPIAPRVYPGDLCPGRSGFRRWCPCPPGHLRAELARNLTQLFPQRIDFYSYEGFVRGRACQTPGFAATGAASRPNGVRRWRPSWGRYRTRSDQLRALREYRRENWDQLLPQGRCPPRLRAWPAVLRARPYPAELELPIQGGWRFSWVMDLWRHPGPRRADDSGRSPGAARFGTGCCSRANPSHSARTKRCASGAWALAPPRAPSMARWSATSRATPRYSACARTSGAIEFLHPCQRAVWRPLYCTRSGADHNEGRNHERQDHRYTRQLGHCRSRPDQP